VRQVPADRARQTQESISAEALAAAIEDGSAPVILDVRSRAEFERGHVPGALHIPFWRLSRRVASIPSPPDAPLVVYCGHGPRAWMAGAILRRRGFDRVRYLEGHMSGWNRARLRQERG
jgi:rhodanese-related sulfurtransferase